MYVNLQMEHYVFVHSILLLVMCTYIQLRRNKILYNIFNIYYLLFIGVPLHCLSAGTVSLIIFVVARITR